MRALLLTVGLTAVVECAFLARLLIRARRRRTRTPGAFRCRIRSPQPYRARGRSRWRGRTCWAAWAHDVLLVQTAPFALPRVLRVRFPEGPVTSATPSDAVGGLGVDPVVLRLRLDGGEVV